MWRVTMVQTIVDYRKVKFAILEREIFDVLKTPGEGSEFTFIDTDIEIGNCDILESCFQQRLIITLACARNENPHIATHNPLIHQLLKRLLIMIDHEKLAILIITRK